MFVGLINLRLLCGLLSHSHITAVLRQSLYLLHLAHFQHATYKIYLRSSVTLNMVWENATVISFFLLNQAGSSFSSPHLPPSLLDELGAEGEADLHPWCGIWSHRPPRCHPSQCHPHLWRGAAQLRVKAERNSRWLEMAAAHPPSLLCHWDGSSCLELLISVLTSLPCGIIHSFCPSCSICVRHCSCASLLEETSAADQHVRLCILRDACSNHFWSQTTDFLFAQSTLPYLHLSQTQKVLRQCTWCTRGTWASYLCCHFLL